MSDDRIAADRVSQMRQAFDRAFAEPRPPEPPPGEDLLAIRVGREPYGLRLAEIAGVVADRPVTPLPGSAAALLGLAGLRGAILPVYDLAALLGHDEAAARRWLAIAAAVPVAFAFAVLDGHFRIARDAVVPGASDDPVRRHVRFFARTAEWVRPVVDLPSVLDAVRQEAALHLARKAR